MKGLRTGKTLYIFHTVMKFEYDAQKSKRNQDKHSIDFDAAQALWDDANLLEIPARTEDEPRWLLIGKISGKHWSAVVTYRDGATRIISVRRSRKEEVALYEGQAV